MIIDSRIGGDRVQFASQLALVPATVIESIKTAFCGDETADFYEGLLAGFATTYQIMQSIPDNPAEYIGAIVAYLSANH